jgi:hypothetical protein
MHSYLNACVAVASLCATALTGRPASAQAQPPIDTLALLRHVRVLADDSMGGRANGSIGQRRAADYIVGELKRLGLEPLGTDGMYHQPVPLTRVTASRDAARLIRVRGALADTLAGTEFHQFGGDSVAFRAFSGRAMHVGTLGPDAPRVLDTRVTRGKVIIADAAPGVPLDDVITKLERQGAAALILAVGDSARYLALRHARGEDRFFVRGGMDAPIARRLPVVLTSPAAGRSLRSKLFAPGSGRASDTSATLRLAITTRFSPVATSNIVARLPGRDPAQRVTAVILSAHYDHIGLARPIDGDSLYNGLIDNAVGVAALLGIAEAMRTSPPDRSVIFLFTTAEEEGSLGSAYYTTRPTLPLARIRAAINVDAGAPLAPPKSWFIESGGDSLISAAAVAAATSRGWTVEIAPAQANSDHWSFHIRGIPIAFPVPGEGWEGVTTAQEEQLIARWWRFHRPDDEWSADFPLAGLARHAEFVMALARQLAG